MLRIFKLLPAITIVALIFTSLMPLTASAHENRKVGKYQLTVGFITEPPIEGVKNGVDLRVTNTETNQPVEGVEKTVKVAIAYKATKKTMEIRTLFRDPGHYTADLIPTAPGQYVFTFTGTIDGLPINEKFESGPGRFNDVQSAVELQFPDTLPEVRELAGVVPATQKAAMEAQSTATSIQTLALAGVVLGALGILVGIGAASIALRSRK